MVQLDKLLGYDTAIENIKQYVLKEGFNQVALLGPSGSGKSWILEKLMSQLSSLDFSIIFLNGDESRKKEPYYPLSLFVETKSKIKKTGKEVIYSALSEIPFVGKPLKALVEGVDTRQILSQKKLNDISEFKRHISFSLHLMGLLKKHKKVLIICDNFSSFDPHSIAYLNDLEAGLRALELNPDLSIIFSGSFDNTNVESIELILKKTLTIKLKIPEKKILKEVLIGLGLKADLSSSDFDVIYTCTGCNLYVLKSLVTYLNGNEFNSDTFGDSELMGKLIDYRLNNINKNNDKINEVLYTLANVGDQTSKSEIVCLSNNDKDIFDTLGIAETMEFIQLKNNYIQFSHEIIRKVFQSRAIGTKLSMYSKLSGCLKRLTPSNYVRRAIVEKYLGNSEEADILWSLVSIGKLRVGLFEEAKEIQKNLTSISSHETVSFLDCFSECYQLSFEGKVTEAISKIENLPNSMPLLLQAEKCYLECQNLSKFTDLAAKQNMLHKLNLWNNLKDDESEIWCRLMQLKILAAKELDLPSVAKDCEFEIINFYSKRISFDTDAVTILNRLDIYAEQIYTAEIAHKKMERVEQKLTIDIEEERFDRIIDLYISRVNLSSNSLLLGMYEKAIKVALSAIELTNEYVNIHFPYPELPLTNMYLAAHFHGTFKAEDIAGNFKDLAYNYGNEEDEILLTINYAGILLCAGLIRPALKELEKYKDTITAEKTDPYYYYYHEFNYCLLAYFKGDVSEAILGLRKLKSIVTKAVPSLDRYYQRHYEIVLELIEEKNDLSYDEMKVLFEEKCPTLLSSIWNKFKFIYLFSDLQIWTSF